MPPRIHTLHHGVFTLVGTCLALLTGCQSMPSGDIEPGIALYATAGQAANIAVGNFGAIPITFERAQDLQDSQACTPPGVKVKRARCVRTRRGRIGWVPTD